MASLDVFLDARTCQDLCTGISAANHSFKQAVASGIMTAMGSGLRTATISTSSKAGADVLNVMHMLNSSILGYSAKLSGTNLVVTW